MERPREEILPMRQEPRHWILNEVADTFQHAGRGFKRVSCPLKDLRIPDDEPGPITLAAFIGATKGSQSTDEAARLQQTLSARFDIPPWLWQAKDQDDNGYFYAANRSSSNDGSHKHVTVFRFQVKYVKSVKPTASKALPPVEYGWHILTFATTWHATQKAALLCFNVPGELQKLIEQSMAQVSPESLTAHPYAIHAIVLQHVVELYDLAIWQFRDPVRIIEKNRPKVEDPNPEYEAMHELGRHVSHSSEVLATALCVMDTLLSELDRVQSSHPSLSQANLSHHINDDPAPSLRHSKSKLQFMQNRSLAIEHRLKNEINLAFHITGHSTNLVNTKIAKVAQSDSSATKTISILGMLFLPGTFISAIFSMSFFNFTPASDDGSPARWRVSGMFWLYWAVAIPVTLVTVGVWFWWQTSPLNPNAPEPKKRARVGDRRESFPAPVDRKDMPKSTMSEKDFDHV